MRRGRTIGCTRVAFTNSLYESINSRNCVIRNVRRQKKATVIFAEHNHSDVANPSCEYIAERVRSITPKGPGYFWLTSAGGSYVQTAGARLKLTVEYRLQNGGNFQHFVLGDAGGSDLSMRQINSASGQINLLANEVLDMDDAIEIFCCFLETGSIPERFSLRDDTNRFAGPERDEPDDARESPS